MVVVRWGPEGPFRVDCASIFKRFSNLVSRHGAAFKRGQKKKALGNSLVKSDALFR